MRFFADLHIHSKFSRATSREMTLESLWKWAQLKGISVLGTGDFTHPVWFKEIKEKLDTNSNNLFELRNNYKSRDVFTTCISDVHFILTSEISCIYSKGGKIRKVHNIVFMPDIYSAEKFNNILTKIGNLSSDGRPILGLDSKVLLKIVLDVSDRAMLIPAHAWTPHFSVFGASSGFDSLEECYEELTPYIYAIETGLSSDPEMNWRISSLDRLTLISNSDAHSPIKLGREANIFNTDITYDAIINAIKTKNGFEGTIEFFPEEGKYHYDGHRNCRIRMSPKESIIHNNICPVCKKKLTIGVLHRVEKLADRECSFKPENSISYYLMIPLIEILSEILKSGINSKRVLQNYFKLLERFGNEFNILMNMPLNELEKAGISLLTEAVNRVRTGDIYVIPGYDGEYGKIKIFERVY
jgi:uncharacterized protein (TIGR00375 family)